MIGDENGNYQAECDSFEDIKIFSEYTISFIMEFAVSAHYVK